MRKVWINFALCVFCLMYVVTSAVAQDTAPAYELAFSNGNIYTVDTKEDVVTQLTHTQHYADTPTWSPDGEQIAFVETLTDDFYGQYGLYVMNADGSNLIHLADDLAWRSAPVWLGSDTMLYATRSDIQSGDCLIKSVKRDGSGAHDVFRKAHASCNVAHLQPSLSPDQKQIVFGLDDTNGKYFQLYKMDLASRQVTQLTHDRANHASPVWSPDGTQIAFVTMQDGQNEIYVMKADGSDIRRLTHRPGDDYAPLWLPDGQQLIFGSDQKGYNVFSLDMSSGVVRNLTNLTDSGAWNVVLSSDGKQIAYATGFDPVSGPDHIRVMSLDTGASRELSLVGVIPYEVAWRP
jgi:TolB protein